MLLARHTKARAATHAGSCKRYRDRDSLCAHLALTVRTTQGAQTRSKQIETVDGRNVSQGYLFLGTKLAVKTKGFRSGNDRFMSPSCALERGK